MKHHIYEPCWSRRQELGVDGGRIKSAQLSHRYQGFTSCLWLGSDNKRTKERKRYSPFSEMVPTLTPIRYTLVKFRETFWFQFYVNTSLCEILMKFLYVEWRKWTICAHIQEFPHYKDCCYALGWRSQIFDRHFNTNKKWYICVKNSEFTS